MGDNTAIEWTNATWNPTVGCTIVSPGCTNCYAMGQAARLLDGNPATPHYKDTTRRVNGNAVWTGKLALAPDDILLQPLKWKRPRMIFVNSMSDLFHESVPDEWIDEVFAVMALAPQHTFQVLTKRADRMQSYFQGMRESGFGAKRDPRPEILNEMDKLWPGSWKNFDLGAFPLDNVWLGVSVEDQARANERIPALLDTPAAIRFVSVEPLLGPIDFRSIDADGESVMDVLYPRTWEEEWEDWRDTEPTEEQARESFFDWFSLGTMPTGRMHHRLDWVIVGGESGPGARPMHPDWARSIRDQCTAAGVPFFFKQWGAWNPVKVVDHGDGPFGVGAGGDPLLTYPNIPAYPSIRLGEQEMWRVGKKRAGRLLDGIEHNAMPGDTA
ncbi:protein gp37 [Microvirga flocculans]|uniref:Protein gp37 n=1 Tax=Microvirga flocculans TaxID=217168 RepID=A0A7W6IJM4_9HYPH|nr:phage Gp37/Gp68 family protein [Microvirga flocculans]MBB4042055.1 protein gp37 [Microvirga flocculans]